MADPRAVPSRSSGVSRTLQALAFDSPRWCDHCQMWGDHHSDRCDRTCPECGQTGLGPYCHHWDATGERKVPTIPQNRAGGAR